VVSPGPGQSGTQEIRFCRSADGVRIAYAVHGQGPPLVISTCWLSHLQHDWESPVWRHFLADLGRFATIIRFDERGYGLSDWDVEDFSLEARIGDLEAVVDDSGVDRFALMGMAQGGPVSIEYTARHPERVTRLLFYGSYAAPMPDPTPEAVELSDTYLQMIKVGWARPDSSFRRVFTTMMIPDATEEQMRWMDELQRVSVSAGTAVASQQVRRWADTRPLLPLIHVPTLVLHSRGDRMNEFELAVALASSIDGARLVALESDNHIVLEDEPAWTVFVDEVERFLAPERSDRSPSDESAAPAAVSPSGPDGHAGNGARPRPDGIETLSSRELEVLRLAARGQDNEEIAQTLSLSVRTVERHLQNVYVKLDLRGKSARTAAVIRLLTRA
jgi:pimeloyl-ACP methyl ester carboxylesterase/DNA-binding CsgD family transcriptional regulator